MGAGASELRYKVQGPKSKPLRISSRRRGIANCKLQIENCKLRTRRMPDHQFPVCNCFLWWCSLTRYRLAPVRNLQFSIFTADCKTPELPQRNAETTKKSSAPPNYDEGCAAESRADFIHKLGISLKELKETTGWLRFIAISHLLREKQIIPLRAESQELSKILGRSIVTARSKRWARPDLPPVS